MITNCFTCGKELDRFPSRLKANPTQFCNFVCLGLYRSRQVDVTCAVCGKEWRVKASLATHGKACSPACLAKLRSANRVRYFGTADTRKATCAQCGTSFIRKPSQLAKYGESFCSKACYAASQIGREGWNNNGEWLPCETCGKDVWRTPATKEPHVYCSRKCVGIHERESRTGKESPFPIRRGADNHNWKGGRSPYGEGFTHTLSKAIRERDSNKCRACGNPWRPGARNLVCHHVDLAKIDHLPSNLVTLCRSCHQRVHQGSLVCPC